MPQGADELRRSLVAAGTAPVEARHFPHGCVASPHYLASASGLAVLADGGNAMDAVLAANLTLGVVAPYFCGYGGDVFALVWDGALHGLLGSGPAPGAATPEAVRRAVQADAIPAFGPHAVTVPGAVDGWFRLAERFGTRSFGDLAQDAIRHARDGIVVSHRASQLLEPSKRAYADSPGWQRVYGSLRAGDVLRQPELAATIELLADGGPRAYYEGPIAAAIVEHLAGLGGLLAEEDLAGYTAEWAVPLCTTYRDLKVAELPPPTQGVTALGMLRLVDGLGALPDDDDARQHLLIEAAKLALSERARHVTDPAHMTVDPRALFTEAWAAPLRAQIDPGRAGSPPPPRPARGGTAYLCAADSDGLLVSLIQSNFMGFGSGVTVPGWGVNLNNRGAYFSLDPAHVDVIAPGKRPLHTLIPALGLRGGRPVLVFGAMGGDSQAAIHLQLLTHLLDDGMDVQQAIAAPRWALTPSDWSLTVENRFDAGTVAGLRARGHEVTVGGSYLTSMGHAHAIAVGDHGYAGGTDPRAEGAVLGL
jgi:gamma-glutamyltranspeptidase/glutathione hydrolase